MHVVNMHTRTRGIIETMSIGSWREWSIGTSIQASYFSRAFAVLVTLTVEYVSCEGLTRSVLQLFSSSNLCFVKN